MHVGDDPYKLIKDAVKVVRERLGTFKLLEEKNLPGIVDKFGWCSWDAFYRGVDAQGVWQGVKSLVEVPRLIDFQENYKFKKYNGKNNNTGMGALVENLKQDFKTIEYVYVWHALCGHWGGIRPKVPGMPESRTVEAKLSPGLKMTMKDSAVKVVLKHGVGMVLETLCEEYGGRVELARKYHQSLTASVIKYFKGNGVIASMQQCNDFMLLGTEAITLRRVGDDFWTAESQTDPSGMFWLQVCHMVYCTYNSLWMGNFFHPDWDMFQSTHPCAQFHAASRAISGGPIYVSDDVGKHDFKLLKSLALPDGSILRCESYALPTKDCLFEDPLHDGKTLLKIWNLNKYTGVIGAFNCQGGGWSRKDRQNKSFSEFSHIVTSTVNPKDVEWENGKKPISIDEVEAFAVYEFQARKLVLVEASKNIEISLEPFTFELLTVSPVNMLWNKRIHFAALGLVNMLNTGGAIQSLKFDNQENALKILVKGTGEMRVFASEKPKVCTVNGGKVSFVYSDEMVAIHVP
ncbi:Galactinol--sucrose galactosyltransferase [Thalictrum thalictroides]|uniref:Galactinol--sucrose galactosyltransferase n=1 Tax=Thalictrum thalictroides TaxID=46969 RepID=A0A7J6XB36_THATH|nr:Galactinol--sucrose galactosyltransferase [Thalictrum thalictroides]